MRKNIEISDEKINEFLEQFYSYFEIGRVMYNYYRADADGHIREHRIIIGAM